MFSGMMWFDNDPKTALKAKIEAAVEYYMRKYYQMPDLVLLHPAMLGEEKIEMGKIAVRAWRAVLPGHLWVGIDAPNANDAKERMTRKKEGVRDASL